MAKPQFYEEYKWVQAIDGIEQQIIGCKTQLQSVKTAIENIKAQVDADTDSTADMVTLANQANNLVNNAKYTDFLTFITNAIG